MTDNVRAAAIALYDRFTHESFDRRAFMAELTRIAGSAAAATALLASIAADPAAAALVPANDRRVEADEIAWQTNGLRAMKGYLAMPRRAGAFQPIVVVHENRGLNDHIRDVARRLAVEGFLALAPDFLSSAGGTPNDADRAREMIGALDMGAAVGDGVATLAFLQRHARARGKIGLTGFCWGGAMVNRLAVAAGPALGSAVSFYGPAPDPAEAAQVQAPIMLQLGGLDERVNATALPWAEALKAAGKTVEVHVYPGANHAFHNDTSAERYDPAAAQLAWDRTLAFFRAHA